MAETTLHTIPAEGSALLARDIRSARLLQKRWLYHVLFWLFYYSLTIVLYLSLREHFQFATYVMTAIQISVQAGFCYINFYILMPRLLFTRKYAGYIVALLGILAVSPFVVGGLEYFYGYNIEHLPAERLHIVTFPNWIVGMITCLYTIGLATGVKFVKDTLINQQLQKEREKHYLETELKFLRTQIQPHFFFNTLNNIYSLTLKKSDEAPDVILKLSDLMSYMLYESTAPLVPLTKEIDYLRNYLDVEQLRFGSRLTISFSIEGLTSGVQIPPMILILFLENCFKHGVKNNISAILITIRLKVEKDYLLFHVENPAPGEEKDTALKGIGLKNVRRRLDLLYGDRHVLDIREENKLFLVTLKMPLC